MFNTIRGAAGTAQYCTKQGFDFRVAVTAHHPFERHDRFNVTILTDQGMSQNESRAPVGTARFQDAGDQVLGSIELLHLQRLCGLLKRLIAGIVLPVIHDVDSKPLPPGVQQRPAGISKLLVFDDSLDLNRRES